MSVLWRWIISRDGVRWCAAIVIACCVTALIRPPTDRHLADRLSKHIDFSKSTADTIRAEHGRMQSGISRIENDVYIIRESLDTLLARSPYGWR